MLKFDNIIVEGADQQGKSELCRKISELTGWSVVHFGPPDSDFDFHKDYLVEKHTISDRNFLSEIVYSKIRNQGHRVKNLPMLQYTMMIRNYLLVLVDREEFYIYEDREEKFSREQIQDAVKIYRSEFEKITITKIKINPHKDMHLLMNLIKDDSI